MAITIQTGFPTSATGAGQSGITVTTVAVGDLLVIGVREVSATLTVIGVSGGGVTTWNKAVDVTDSTDSRYMAIWYGTVTSTGTHSITILWDGIIGSISAEIVADSFTGLSSWVATSTASTQHGANTSGTMILGPSLTAPTTPSLYWGYARASSAVGNGDTTGFTYYATPTSGNNIGWNGACNASTAYAPDWYITTNSNYDIVGVMFAANSSITITAPLGTASASSENLQAEISIGPPLGAATASGSAPTLSTSGTIAIVAPPGLATASAVAPVVGSSPHPYQATPVIYPAETYPAGSSLVAFPASPSPVPRLPSPVRILRELPSTRVHVGIATPKGRYYRWGRDEPRGENVPSGLRWSTTAPGGFETLDAVLPRSPRHDYDDLNPLSDLRVYGPGGRVAGEYRLEGSPVTSGDRMSVSPAAVGWQANLSDNGSASCIIIERDLGKWGDTTNTRKEALWSLGYAPGQGSFSVDPGVPASLKLQITSLNQTWPPNTTNRTAIAETWFDSGPGTTIGQVRADYHNLNLGAGWAFKLYLFNTQTQAYDSGVDLVTSGGTSTVAHSRPDSNSHWRGILLQMYYGGSFTGDGEWDGVFENMRVIGTHGLQLVGASSAVEGVYASDAVKYIVNTYAPMLRCDDSTIQHSSYIIPQLAFYGVDPGEMVNQTIRFGIPVPDWFVWEDRWFHLHERGIKNHRWRARIGPSQLSATGPDLSKQFNSVMVSYTDVDGTTKTVGPPGSGADVESPLLVDSDPTNLLNQVRDFNGNAIVRRAPLSLGTSTSDIATDVGQEFLSESKGISLAGQAQHVGWIEDADTGIVHPYHAIRAGDEITYSDASDTSFRRVSRTDCSDDTKSNSVSLDAPSDTLQGLLERLGAEIVSVGIG